MAERQRLRAPVGELFHDRLPERHVQRLWHRIERARSTRRTVPTSLALAFAFASACAAVGVLLWFRPTVEKTPEALHLLDGKDVPATLSTTAEARTSFEDTSEVHVAARTELDVLANDGGKFSLALRRGAAEFEVHPGGPRTWKIECGGITVEVVGTHFSLARDAASLRVAVTRGAVVVRGDRVPDGVVRLGAGQSLTVPFDLPSPVSSSWPEPKPSEAPVVPKREPESAPLPSVEPRHPAGPPASALVAPSVASAEATASSAEPPPGESVDALLDQADAARRSGNFRNAAELLERAIRISPSAPHVALAEFSLGRLYLDSLSDPARAAAHFSRAAAGGLPGALAEDADARLVEAYAKAGNAARASEAASRYRARYPAGRRSADVDRWSASVH